MSRPSALVFLSALLLSCTAAAETDPWFSANEDGTIKEANAYHIMLLDKTGADKVVAELRQLPREKQFPRLKELARKISKDPGSARQDGSLGFIREGMFARDFEEKLFRLQVDEISDPIKSPYGWHVVTLRSLSERPVIDLCRDQDDAVMRTADQRMIPILQFSKLPPDKSLLHAKVMAIVGSEWGEPLANANGSMVLIRAGKRTVDGTVPVTLHTEYLQAQYLASDHVCARSSRAEHVVDCSAGSIRLLSMSVYLARGATGLPAAVQKYKLDALKGPFAPSSMSSLLFNAACPVT